MSIVLIDGLPWQDATIVPGPKQCGINRSAVASENPVRLGSGPDRIRT